MNVISDKTILTYDKYHQIYDDETIEFWANFPKKILERFAKQLLGNKILDLGSGPGRDATLLRDMGLAVVCLDASSEMVKRTRDLGFVSIKRDMRNLDFPKCSFDGVWAFTSLLHITKIEMEKVLKTIHEVLKPGGVFLIGMIEGEFEGEVERESMPGTKRFFRFYSGGELKK